MKERDAQRKAKRKKKDGDDDAGVRIEVENNGDFSDHMSDDEGGFFEETPLYDENASFASMNFSRPLMKVG